MSGNVDQWIYEWDLSNKFNQKFGKRFKVTLARLVEVLRVIVVVQERDIGNDIIRGPPASHVPAIAYYTIKRTA